MPMRSVASIAGQRVIRGEKARHGLGEIIDEREALPNPLLSCKARVRYRPADVFPLMFVVDK